MRQPSAAGMAAAEQIARAVEQFTASATGKPFMDPEVRPAVVKEMAKTMDHYYLRERTALAVLEGIAEADPGVSGDIVRSFLGDFRKGGDSGQTDDQDVSTG